MTRQAFEHIAHELRPRLKDIAQRFFGDEDKAEDVAQETLMRLWLLRDRIAPQADIGPLAVRMAKNLCVSEWRKQQVRQGQAVQVEFVAHCDIQRDVELKEDIDRLRQAVNQLKPAEQRLFRMRHEAEMDISQIAAATGVGERSVSAMLSTAKRKLQEILTQKGGLQ
jgi:RNA polymerase sigma factor (sigma-70 family)